MMQRNASDRQLAEAQKVLDEHATSSLDGRCRVCGGPGPCWQREAAVAIFSRLSRLPQRVPGASRTTHFPRPRVAAGTS